MTEPQAYLNGRFVPASQAMISVADGGFVQGTTVAEQLRTFGGKLFRLEAHIQRLFHSLAIVEVDPGLGAEALAETAQKLVAFNHALLAPGDDLGLAMFVTPGAYPTMVPNGTDGPTVCMHTFPLRFTLWADKYRTGQSLATTDVVQVSPRSWPSELKCRSRMHYYLADRQARARDPGSRALVLDEEGFVTETTTANVVVFEEKTGLVTPPRHKILPGISMAVLAEFAARLGIAHVERELRPADLLAADEVYLTSTSPCMVSVVRLDGQAIGGGAPGTMYGRFLAAWNALVGLDIAEQARRFAAR